MIVIPLNELFSLKRFIEEPGSGVLVISQNPYDYGHTEVPMNAALFWRLVQLLDNGQHDPRRKVFIVLDEFTALAGDKPCPGMTYKPLRLRSKGTTELVTYQSFSAVKQLYAEQASAILGQYNNVIYLTQPDVESAEYAAKDLGHERGWERKTSVSYGSEYASVTQHEEYFERPYVSPTELQNLRPASKERGIEGWAKSPGATKSPWIFKCPPEQITAIPKTSSDIAEYIEWEAEAQRLRPLTDEEKTALGLGENRAS